MAADPVVRNLNQFEMMGNYRFHYYVTGNTLINLGGPVLFSIGGFERTW